MIDARPLPPARGGSLRPGMFLAGCLCLLAAPVIGVLPGPGGIVLAGIGLSLVLRTSCWAKRRYVTLKRRMPQTGEWADWAMRRPSARRRRHLARVAADD